LDIVDRLSEAQNILGRPEAETDRTKRAEKEEAAAPKLFPFFQNDDSSMQVIRMHQAALEDAQRRMAANSGVTGVTGAPSFPRSHG
jgi:hypothetical protein